MDFSLLELHGPINQFVFCTCSCIAALGWAGRAGKDLPFRNGFRKGQWSGHSGCRSVLPRSPNRNCHGPGRTLCIGKPSNGQAAGEGEHDGICHDHGIHRSDAGHKAGLLPDRIGNGDARRSSNGYFKGHCAETFTCSNYVGGQAIPAGSCLQQCHRCIVHRARNQYCGHRPEHFEANHQGARGQQGAYLI